ncbi:MAG: DUF3829 domain-containing protein [Sandaracinaceae bacterium]
MLESALRLMRRVRDGEAFSDGERMRFGGQGNWMVEGSFGQLQDRYNHLIVAYNRLR